MMSHEFYSPERANGGSPRQEQEHSVFSELAKIQRAPHIQFGAQSVVDVANRFLVEMQLGSQQDASVTHDRRKRVLVILGPPGSGKTWVKGLMHELIDRRVSPFHRVEKLSWEHDGEEEARKRGKIETPRDKPFTNAELREANALFSLSVYHSLLSHDVITIEVPAVSAVRIDNAWRGRMLGGETLYAMVHKRGLFEQLQYDTHVYYMGLVEGPLIRYVMDNFRDDTRRCKTLARAQYLAFLYGKRIPQNMDEWRALQEGASIEQIRKIENTMYSLVHQLVTRGEIRGYYQDFEESAYYEQAKSIADMLGVSKATIINQVLRYISIGELMEYFFRNTNNLGIPTAEQENVVIGYNNPTIEDLYFPNVASLRKHLKDRKGIK